MSGQQFECLVLNHLPRLFPLLGLDQSLVLSAAPYVQRKTEKREGCQIDLLIQTHWMLLVVEIKRRKEIKYEVVDEVAEKIRRLQHRKDLSIRTALVYDGNLAKTVPADHFFDFIIPAEKIFEVF